MQTVRDSPLFALCRRGIFFSLFFSIFLLSGGVPAAYSQDSKENAEFKLAVGLYNDGMYDLAAEQFKNFINAYPATSQGIEARFSLGLTQEKLKRYEESRMTFQNFALSYVEHPKAPEAWLHVGDAFLALGNLREAANAYERVRVFHPKSQLVSEALLRAGQLYRRIGDRENAKKDFRALIQEYPSSPSVLPARLAISEMYAEEGQTELAEREARRVSESDAPAGVKASALFSIGRLQVMTSLFEAAEETFSLVIARYKNTPAAVAAEFELGKLQMSNRKYPSAIENFHKVESSDQADDSLAAAALIAAGTASLRMHDNTGAQKSFEQFLTRFGGNPLADEAGLEAGRAALAEGNARQALEHALKILSRPQGGRRPDAMLLAARAALALGRPAEAARSYTAYIEAAPDERGIQEAMLALARLYEETLQDCRKATWVLDQLTQKYPQSRSAVEALTGIGRCQEALGDESGALKTYTDLQSRYPANDSTKELRTKIEFLRNHKLKDRDAGIEKLASLMGEVLRQHSQAELSFRLGGIYFTELKDYEAAASQFSAAVENGLSGDARSEAQFLLARSYELQSEVSGDALPKALSAYDTFLREYPEGLRSDEAAYRLYAISARSQAPAARMLLAREFFAQHPASLFRDRVLLDVSAAQLSSGDSLAALRSLGSLCTEFPGSPLEPEALLGRGVLFLGLGQSDSAFASWKHILATAPDGPEAARALWALAAEAWRRNDAQNAAIYWKRLIADFPYTSLAEKAESMLPEAFLATGEYDEAIARLSPAVADPGTLYNLACAYEKKGDRQQAVHYYNLYLLADRRGLSASKAFYALGGLARAQGRIDDASAYFKQAAALGGTGSATRDIADLLFQTEQYGEAARQYSQLAREEDTLGVRAFYQARTIVATLRQDKLSEAQGLIAEFKDSFRQDERYQAEFEYEKGLSYYRKQDYSNARKVFEKVGDDYERTPSGPWGRYYLGKILEVTEKLADAARQYESILSKYPDSDCIPRVLLSLGNMHFNAERYEQAIKYYQQITRAPERAGEILSYAMNNLIEAYESLKLYDEALKLTKEYIERFPSDQNIIDKKIKLGTLYTQVGYYDQAVLHFQNLISEAGSLQEAELRYDIGEAYYSKGDYQQAILEFLKVPYLVSRQGKVNWTATALYMAGQSYEKMSKFDEALQMYQQIIDRAGIDATFKAAARKEIDRVKSIMKKDTK